VYIFAAGSLPEIGEIRETLKSVAERIEVISSQIKQKLSMGLKVFEHP
jgi:hypothetical protein